MGDADIFSECGHARNHEFCTQISALKFQGVSRCKFSCKNERDFRWRVEYRAAFPWSQISPVKAASGQRVRAQLYFFVREVAYLTSPQIQAQMFSRLHHRERPQLAETMRGIVSRSSQRGIRADPFD
jgi:hypothetical protein